MQKTVDFILDKINGFKPEIAIILGSGLGDLADDFSEIVIPYSEIPNFPVSTVAGHKGRLVFATINNKKIMMMQGRFHFYEGHSIETVVYPIKIMKKLGIKTLIITNAAGGINTNFRPSDLMLIKDHINLLGTNPLIGKNDDSLGTRFPDMTDVYTQSLQELAKNTAKKLDIELQEGVYVASTGPSYETPAEIRMMKTMGADAVGMSTVPEAIVAHYCGINVLGFSCICNLAAGLSKDKLSHSEVLEAANSAKTKFRNLILEIIKDI